MQEKEVKQQKKEANEVNQKKQEKYRENYKKDNGEKEVALKIKMQEKEVKAEAEETELGGVTQMVELAVVHFASRMGRR